MGWKPMLVAFSFGAIRRIPGRGIPEGCTEVLAQTRPDCSPGNYSSLLAKKR